MNTAAETFPRPGRSAAGVSLMAHMIAHFPDRRRSLEVAKGLAAGGAAFLEVQFPFSDPSADGRLIQTAGNAALAAGFTVEAGFDLVREIRETTGVPLFIMSYGNLVYRRGVERFVRSALAAGATGLIIPDLSPGSDEGLYDAGRAQGVEIVPVVAPSVTEERIGRIADEGPRRVYAALRVGITGSYTEIGEENLRFLERLAALDAGIIAGFGISTPDQVTLLAPHVDTVVVGSAFVKTVLDAVDRNATGQLAARLEAQVRGLLPGGAPP